MHPRVALVLALLLSGAAGCLAAEDDAEPVAESSARIIGGSKAFPGEFPGVVGLYDGVHLCTATLIHSDWALTAAHCVTPSLTGYADLAEVTGAFSILLDDVDLTDQQITSRSVRLREIFMHPSWNPKDLGDNDIAVLHLAEPVTDRKPVPIYRLPVPNGTPVTQVGYGVNDPQSNSGAGVLRVLNTSTADCDQYGYSDIEVLCFDANDGDGTCFGDSGGPTFVTVAGAPEISGITSFGSSELCIGYDVSTHVAGELEFIDSHVPKVQGGTPQVTDPSAETEIGPAPTIFSGCSVGVRGRAPGASGAAAVLLALACLVLWHRRRRA